MRYSSSLLVTAFAVTNVFSYSVVKSVKGANGVELPGLSVAHQSTRDCVTPPCGSEADTSNIHKRELGTKKVIGETKTPKERRAIESKLRKRNFARALINKRKPDAVSDALAALEATGSATKAEDGEDEIAEKNLAKRLTPEEEREQAEIDKQVEEEDKDEAAEGNQKRELSKRLTPEEEREQAEIDKQVEEEDRDEAAEGNQKRELSKRLTPEEEREQAEIDKQVEEEDKDEAAEGNQKRELSKRLTPEEEREQAEIDKQVEEEDKDEAAEGNQKRELTKRLTPEEEREQAEIDKQVEEEDRE